MLREHFGNLTSHQQFVSYYNFLVWVLSIPEKHDDGTTDIGKDFKQPKYVTPFMFIHFYAVLVQI